MRQLTAVDRCDSCQAQAYAQATVNGSELLYCMHHWTKYEARLVLVASEYDVDRDAFERLDEGR